MHGYIVINLLLFVFSSCLNKNVSDYKLNNTLSKTLNQIDYQIQADSSISFSLDQETAPSIQYFQILQHKTGSYYVLYNNYNKIIYLYNLINGQLSYTVPLENIDYTVIGFYFYSIDSFLVFPEYGDHYHQYSSSVKNKKIGYIDIANKGKLFFHRAFPWAPIFANGTKIYLNNIHGSIAIEGDTINYLIIEHDVTNNLSRFFLKHSSKGYHKNLDATPFTFTNYAYNHHQNILYYSFPYDPDIYIYDITNHSIIDTIINNYHYKEIDVIPKNLSIDKQLVFVRQNTTFNMLLFDSINNILIRGVMIPFTIDEINNQYTFLDKSNDFYYIIYNLNNQSQTKTTTFSSDEFNLDNTFIYNGRLYINQQSANEDIMRFKIIKYVD